MVHLRQIARIRAAIGASAAPPAAGAWGFAVAIRVIRLGSPRASGEGLRLGTVRRPPRGVRKRDYARRDYFDLWFPELAPSAGLVRFAYAVPFTDLRWAQYVRAYRREMAQPDRQRLLALLARLSRTTDFSVGCYCESEGRCHRSILRDLLTEQGAKVAIRRNPSRKTATSPK